MQEDILLLNLNDPKYIDSVDIFFEFIPYIYLCLVHL